MELIPQAELQLSFFFLISGPLKQGIVFLHLVLKEIIKFWTINRYIQFWNWMSEMSFLVCFQFTASLLKKLVMFLNFYHYMQFLGTYSGLYILSQSYLLAWFTILQCIILLSWKIFQSLRFYSSGYLLTWEQCLWNVDKRN